MAQLIRCDFEGCPNLYDVMVSRQANGETLAWCDEHFVTFCGTVVEQVAQAEADRAAVEAIDRLQAEAGGSSSTEPEHVVKRGTSRSRRAFEARARAKAAAGGPTGVAVVAGPDDDEPDDADEATSEAVAEG